MCIKRISISVEINFRIAKKKGAVFAGFFSASRPKAKRFAINIVSRHGDLSC